MKKRTLHMFSLTLIVGILLTACQGSAPVQTSEPVPDEPESFQPIVVVHDQEVTDGILVIDEVKVDGPSWVVIHTQQNGAPGPVIGFTAISAGSNTAVEVEIDVADATDNLLAMLHIDAGILGEYEFPGADVPLRVAEEIVSVPFTISRLMDASVRVSDQELQEGKVVIETVVAAEQGWIVIHAESDGAPGPVVGFSPVNPGSNSNIEVELDLEAVTETLFAMLHVDAGVIGQYEFPGPDGPVQVGESIVNVPFAVLASQAENEDGTVKVVDNRFEQREITIPVGTTVVWTMSAQRPHTVTSDEGLFDSGTLQDGDTYSYTFSEAGDYPYYCVFHGGPGGQGMAGVVIVTEN
jgi:plastocyanin